MSKITKTGLILEGGGMRGVFTAGILDFFIEKGLEFDTCFGVSAGAWNKKPDKDRRLFWHGYDIP